MRKEEERSSTCLSRSELVDCMGAGSIKDSLIYRRIRFGLPSGLIMYTSGSVLLLNVRMVVSRACVLHGDCGHARIQGRLL